MKKILRLCLMALLFAGCSSGDDEAELIPEPVPQDTTKNETTEMPETPQTKGYAAQYRVAKLFIETDGGQAVDSKEKKDYRACTIRIESDTAVWNYEGRGRVRGRGNSTWLWYPKSPIVSNSMRKHRFWDWMRRKTGYYWPTIVILRT